MSEMQQWWYCLKHNRAEGADGCANVDRMGPYETQEQASRALQTAAERTEAWDHDPRWNDDDS
ncbi:MAG: hypothetical protein M3P48_11820 [Actinomycetota bacterium]|nr:hypothetical protein [Actinomycetota bacterium]